MAFVAKVETIANSGADGCGAAAVWSRIETELDTWITSVNANNATRLLSFVVKPSQTTSALYNGCTISFNEPTAGTRYLGWRANNSATSITGALFTTHTPGATNGGHGTYNTIISQTSFTMSASSGYTNIVICDDTSGSEYFYACIRGSTATTSTFILIAKSSAGNWFVSFNGGAYTASNMRTLGVGAGTAWVEYSYSPSFQFISGSATYSAISGPWVVSLLSPISTDPFGTTDRVSIKFASAVHGKFRHTSITEQFTGIQTADSNDIVCIGPYMAFDFEGLV